LGWREGRDLGREVMLLDWRRTVRMEEGSYGKEVRQLWERSIWEMLGKVLFRKEVGVRELKERLRKWREGEVLFWKDFRVLEVRFMENRLKLLELKV
jgi:hypothetical protein